MFLLSVAPSLCFIILVSFAPQKTIRVAEISLRRAANRIVMPVFPKASEANKVTGVAVAQIEFNAQGEVDKAEVLEAPDEQIKLAVAEAVKQWRFQPQQFDNETVRIRGKLTFYFVLDDRGRGRVENPKQPKQRPKSPK